MKGRESIKKRQNDHGKETNGEKKEARKQPKN